MLSSSASHFYVNILSNHHVLKDRLFVHLTYVTSTYCLQTRLVLLAAERGRGHLLRYFDTRAEAVPTK